MVSRKNRRRYSRKLNRTQHKRRKLLYKSYERDQQFTSDFVHPYVFDHEFLNRDEATGEALRDYYTFFYVYDRKRFMVDVSSENYPEDFGTYHIMNPGKKLPSPPEHGFIMLRSCSNIRGCEFCLAVILGKKVRYTIEFQKALEKIILERVVKDWKVFNHKKHHQIVNPKWTFRFSPITIEVA